MAGVKQLENGAFSVYWSLEENLDKIAKGSEATFTTNFKCDGRKGLYKMELKATRLTCSLNMDFTEGNYRLNINCMKYKMICFVFF